MMDNKSFLEKNKNKFPNLKYFYINNNSLVLNAQTPYFIPLNYINLSKLPTTIYYLNPIIIYKILYMFEFLHKPNISEKEKKFIEDYTANYFEMNKKAIENNEVNNMELYGFGLPINFSYDEQFKNNPASIIIKNFIDNKENDIENGRESIQKLILSKGQNANFDIEEEFDSIKSFEKAGFTSLLLITSSIISTILYIAYFILGK